ncbi:MAG TPA: biotin--[acetyl-CoA-carboxylase] ligase [Sphingomicrobium sp.]|nr:biotin--[acetyl-CoA-carboxylase] ligase [Sphingomicrobium sp.]
MSRIRIVERTGSTNADLLADASAAEGDWLVALSQDAGRGRQGRDWVSKIGNFFGSTVVEVRSGDPPAQALSLVCGLALIEAVNAAAPGLPLMLKWPNDLLLGGAKLAGILLERQGQRVIAGFGVNLASAPKIEGREVEDLGGRITPQAFAPLLAGSMTRLLTLWRTSAPEAFGRAWLARAHPVGTILNVHATADEVLSGKFAGIENDGALRLLLHSGREEVVRAGDVDLG